MSLFSFRPSACLAFLLALVAFPSAVKGQVEVDVGQTTSTINNYYQYSTSLQATILFGCVGSGTYSWKVNTGAPTAVPPSGIATATLPLSGQGSIATNTTTPVDYERSHTFSFVLLKFNPATGYNTEVDRQEVTVKVKGKALRITSGTPFYGTGGVCAVSLKPGADSSTVRVPVDVLSPNPPDEDTEDILLIGDVPNYFIEEGTGRVIPVNPVTLNVNGTPTTFNNGVTAQIITVPAGSIPAGGGVPGFIQNGFPSAQAVSNPGGVRTYLGTAPLNSYTPPATYGSLIYNQGLNGGFGVTAIGTGLYSDKYYDFPAGYVPKKVDGVPDTEDNKPDLSTVDDCFKQGLRDLGLNTDEPVEVDPDTPPTPGPLVNNPPLPSGGSGGSGGGGGGTGGSGGGGGGTGGFPLPPVPGPGTNPDPSTGPGTTPGPTTGGTGDKPAEAGKPLPGDGDSEKEADKLAQGMSSSLGQLQQKAERLMKWADVKKFEPGQLGDWNINFPINGRNYTVRVPTEHAPMVRQLLLLVFTGYFIVAVFNLLTK